jgi:DNA modification methylase
MSAAGIRRPSQYGRQPTIKQRKLLMERGGGEVVLVTFDQWTQGRAVPSLGTNNGANELPFQSWRHFKEAFTPELIARAVRHSKIPVSRCLDAFGGSGTTALACQFLGIHPVIVEVNPFLADLIEAKLSIYDPDKLAHDIGAVARSAAISRRTATRLFKRAPKTFLEPGVNGRWIFDRSIADRIAALLGAIDALPNRRHRRLFRVLLGGILINVSNVVVNGKGRRYRRSWEQRSRDDRDVDELFCAAARRAIAEIHRFSQRMATSYKLLRGDSRKVLRTVKSWDLAVFSPPYPNSFDYTDVYNVELWTLGYLQDAASNQTLRASTISSHVQIDRRFSGAPRGSTTLDDIVTRLAARRQDLWDSRIPEMAGAYFADLSVVLDHIHRALTPGGSAWMVIGDSSYAGIQILSAEIVAQLSAKRGWTVARLEPFRSMRSSAQQGGRHELGENLLVLEKKITR